MTLLASVLFGLVPALRLSSATAGDALKQLSGGTVAGRRRSRPLASVLIGLEVAVVTFRLDVPEYKYAEPPAAARVLTSVHERLQRLPSITAAGASTRFPLSV